MLLHNRNEEVEHGMMTLEWLRRNDATFDKFMRRYLFKDEDIIAIEEAAEAAEQEDEAGGRRRAGGLATATVRSAIRSLRGP